MPHIVSLLSNNLGGVFVIVGLLYGRTN